MNSFVDEQLEYKLLFHRPASKGKVHHVAGHVGHATRHPITDPIYGWAYKLCNTPHLNPQTGAIRPFLFGEVCEVFSDLLPIRKNIYLHQNGLCKVCSVPTMGSLHTLQKGCPSK